LKPSLQWTEPERCDYLVAVASLARADGHIDESERRGLQEMAEVFELSPRSLGRVLAACEAVPPDFPQVLQRLAASPARYALLVDACSYGYADRSFVTREEDHVLGLAGRLGVPAPQALAIVRFVRDLYQALEESGGAPEPAAIEQARLALARAGVPLRAVRLSGTLWGLEQSGLPLGAEEDWV
jgi:uncharacterized tellurite resistance protein B-like protein